MVIKRINFWSSPRNISTALMYSFAQREDTHVVDEPLYAHYLLSTNSEADHPGRQEIIDDQRNNASDVVNEVIFGQYHKPIVLFKQMTHHLINMNDDFLKDTLNVLLIRDPRKIIASYSKVIPNPTIEDIGVKAQLTLFEKLSICGTLYAIVDARELLLNPKWVLKQLCEALNIDFDKNMLQWEPGPRQEDGVWAKYWYHNVHQSSGFQPYVEKQVELPDHLEALAQICQPYYDSLFLYALKHDAVA